jgi:hypothetical protein
MMWRRYAGPRLSSAETILHAVGAGHDRLDRVDRLVHAAADRQRSAQPAEEDRQPAQPQQQLGRVDRCNDGTVSSVSGSMSGW